MAENILGNTLNCSLLFATDIAYSFMWNFLVCGIKFYKIEQHITTPSLPG